MVDELLFCPLDEESMDSEDTLLAADIIDAFGGVTSRPNELLPEQLKATTRKWVRPALGDRGGAVGGSSLEIR